MHGIWVLGVSVVIGLLGVVASPASADDLGPIRVDVERALPEDALDRVLASPPLVFRGAPRRGSLVYRERVNGVVLIASTNTVGTGVVVSEQGDIITNEHVVRDAHKARGDEWVAVWFKPSNGVRPAKSDFLLARILQRNQRRDLAHIQLTQFRSPPRCPALARKYSRSVIRRPTSGPSARASCLRFERTMSGSIRTAFCGARRRFRLKLPSIPATPVVLYSMTKARWLALWSARQRRPTACTSRSRLSTSASFCGVETPDETRSAFLDGVSPCVLTARPQSSSTIRSRMRATRSRIDGP